MITTTHSNKHNIISKDIPSSEKGMRGKTTYTLKKKRKNLSETISEHICLGIRFLFNFTNCLQNDPFFEKIPQVRFACAEWHIKCTKNDKIKL
jgi:hypothetical protein